VNILDENVSASQVDLLKSWRIPIRQIGYDIGRKGLQDDEIIPFLLEVRHPTFFTRDIDFYKRNLCHAHYCLVYMTVEQQGVANFVRRLLRHREFDTEAKRMGTVIRISQPGITAWRLHAEQEISFTWDP
jgi:hypothetical protein